MKIIDLFNNIANNKEVPKKIKYDGFIYEYSDNDKFYYDNMGNSLYRDFYTEGNCLNNEVEIIEDKPKKIDKLDYKYLNMYKRISDHKYSEIDIIDKVNEIREAVNYLLEKSDKE